MTSTIILLIGPSSAGKTSLAKVLQGLLDEPFLHFEVDSVMSMVPEWCIDKTPRDTPPAHGGFWWRQDESEPNAPLLTQIGLYGQQLILAMHRAIRTLADSGLNLIVDDVIYDPSWLEDLLHVLGDHRVLFVAVRCSLGELERREIQRGNRQTGQARGDLAQLYDPGIYDLEIDTATATVEECAQRILARLGETLPFQAWARLKKRRVKNDAGSRARDDGHRPGRHRSVGH